MLLWWPLHQVPGVWNSILSPTGLISLRRPVVTHTKYIPAIYVEGPLLSSIR
jgi:hypothetical protein